MPINNVGLNKIKKLYDEGDLILNQIVLEKI